MTTRVTTLLCSFCSAILVAILILASIPKVIIVHSDIMASLPAPEERERSRAVITAYSSVETCDPQNCIMANGKRAQVGYVACPRSVALGTIVELQGVAYECGDRTAKRYDGRYDKFMGYGREAHRRALEFGKQELAIKILK